jgi:RNA polymerase sigma factor (sigma-70 family)
VDRFALLIKCQTPDAFWQHRGMSEEREQLAAGLAGSQDAGIGDLVSRAEAEPVAAQPDGEVDALARRAQAGDVAARERLIGKLLPLVAAAAARYRTQGLDQTDLIQDGIVGLLRALERFDPDRGVPFQAFAGWWIRDALQNARSDFVRPFRLPPKALRQLSQLKSEHQRIYQAEQRSAGVAELANRTHIELDQAVALAAADARVRSLDERVDAEGGELGSLGDLLEDPLSAEAYEAVIDAIAATQLRALLARLTDREREIVAARFGFDRPVERLVDIGQRLGVSAERVRQIEERALAKLRHAGT